MQAHGGGGEISQGFLDISQSSCCSLSLGQALCALASWVGLSQMFLFSGGLDGIFFPPLCTEHIGIDLNIVGKGPSKSTGVSLVKLQSSVE